MAEIRIGNITFPDEAFFWRAMTDDLKPNLAISITEIWGPRCPDFEENCIVCRKWQAFDYVFENPFTENLTPQETTDAAE